MAQPGARRGPGAPGGGQPQAPRHQPHDPARARVIAEATNEELWAAGRTDEKKETEVQKKVSTKYKDSVKAKNEELQSHYVELKRLKNVAKGAKGDGAKQVLLKTVANYEKVLQDIKEAVEGNQGQEWRS
ncbi:unnamed protein product [Urochloa humidicola]